MKILTLLLLASCTQLPVRPVKKYTAIDKTYSCMVNLVEKNGITPTEAEKVCSRIFRRNLRRN